MIFLLLANYPCKTTAESNMKPSFHFSYAFLLFLFLLLHHHHYTFSLKTCPNCGSIQVPYPLSTEPNCGDPSYALHCDPHSQKLYFNTLNGSSYMVLKIMSSTQRMMIQPSPWLQGTTSCVTQDMPISNGLWLNQSLPFKITTSNTVFLLNCSPRLLVSPLNCTSSSLCHSYLESSGHVDTKRALDCANGLIHPCCTFVAGGVPSSYKIRLHSSGCKAFRSIIHLDEDKPPNQWEEGLEIQWNPPPEPICKTQNDCPKDSKCSPYGRCLCNKGRNWDPFEGTCLRDKKKSNWKTYLVVSIGVVTFLSLAVVLAIIAKYCKVSNYTVKRDREEYVLKSRDGEKPCRMFQLKEVKKATNDFSQERMLGSGGFGEVYKGELQDGTMVAVKKARVGNLKSTQQVLNEVEILSQVNHKNLVRLLGCCVESEQPLMVYEYISNGTLYDHLHGIRYSNFLDLKTRLKVAFQTAEALAYLHSSAHTPIYHRDVKSTNILLDDEFNAKVSDFGLSRLANPGLSHVSTCAQGTLGYLDPEYYRNYQLTDKSDVYSYGVVLLEILTSKKVVDFSRNQDDVNLAIHVSQHANNGTIMEVVDQRLLPVEDDNKMIRSIELLLELALDCLREKKGERPSMKDIVQRLLCIIRIVDHERNADHHEVSV